MTPMRALYPSLLGEEKDDIRKGKTNVIVTSHVQDYAACNCVLVTENGDRLQRTISYAFLYHCGLLPTTKE